MSLVHLRSVHIFCHKILFPPMNLVASTFALQLPAQEQRNGTDEPRTNEVY
jgi:hypothetical protein